MFKRSGPRLAGLHTAVVLVLVAAACASPTPPPTLVPTPTATPTPTPTPDPGSWRMGGSDYGYGYRTEAALWGSLGGNRQAALLTIWSSNDELIVTIDWNFEPIKTLTDARELALMFYEIGLRPGLRLSMWRPWSEHGADLLVGSEAFLSDIRGSKHLVMTGEIQESAYFVNSVQFDLTGVDQAASAVESQCK